MTERDDRDEPDLETSDDAAPERVSAPASSGGRPPAAGARAFGDPDRQRRRSVLILSVLGAFLLLSFLAAFAYIQGWIPPGSAGEAAPPPPAATSSRSCTTPPAPPATKTITVNVYNTTQRAGLAAGAAKVLTDQGFLAGQVGNDPLAKQVAAAAEIRYAPAAEAKAKVVAQRFPGAVMVPDAKRTDDAVDVALGSAFTAVAPPVTQSPTPSC